MSFILGIESSCDECAAAVYSGRDGLRSSAVHSQIDLHARYGGIVPELASRRHLETIAAVVEEALGQAHLKLSQVAAVAVTQGPGLIGSLLTGLTFAKSLALALSRPLIGIDHLQAHLYSAFLAPQPPPFPYLALVVSGGHTSLYLIESFERRTLLGKTLDDAAGEAFDKAAKLLQLGYPGGAKIEKLARQGKADAVSLPLPFPAKTNLNFSFSGLKTALAQHLQRRPPETLSPQEIADLALAYQEAIVRVLASKALAALKLCGAGHLVLCGGVAANRALRERMAAECAKVGCGLTVPPLEFCTDNAAMVAFLGYIHYLQNRSDPLTLAAYARSEENRR